MTLSGAFYSMEKSFEKIALTFESPYAIRNGLV